MKKESEFEGFVPDKTPKHIVNGVAIALFVTSCILALTLFPIVFSTKDFLEAIQFQYVDPTNKQLIAIITVSLRQLGWMLAPFIGSALIVKGRKGVLAYSTLLTIAAWWWFEFLPYNYAGNILLAGIWSACTLLLIIYRKELD